MPGHVWDDLSIQECIYALLVFSHVPVRNSGFFLEEMFEFFVVSAADHRHFSPHIHHPLSKPPADSRRKRSSEGRKEGRQGSAPDTEATIEEDQEEEEGEEDCHVQTYEEGRTTAAAW